jgi:choline-sulfatase
LKLLNLTAKQNKPFALFFSYIDPHDIYSFLNHTSSEELSNIPLSKSWSDETFKNKPSVQKQFMVQDQGKQIWGKDQKSWELYRDYYRQKVRLYDNHFGTIIRELKKLGYWENTIVISTSDHGDMDTFHKLIFKGPFMYEQMVRIPFIIRIPEKLGGASPKHVSDLNVVNVDFVPTLLDFCGISPYNCDGISLKPILTGKRNQQKRDFVISQYYSKQKWVNPIRMIRTPDYKFNRYIFHGEELYDLKNDPDELVNLVHHPAYQKIKKQLSDELDIWIIKNNDPFYSLKPTDRNGNNLI